MLTLEINATQPWHMAPDGNVADITRRLAITPRSIRHSTFGFRHLPLLALRRHRDACARLFDGETELSLVA